MEHVVSASCQRSHRWLWKQQWLATALSMARPSLALIAVLFMGGLSLVFIDRGNVAHAAQVNCLHQATRSAHPASHRVAAAPATTGLTSGSSNVLARPSLSTALPLSTYGTGKGLTLILRNVDMTIVIRNLELELISS
jgi:hypothetical protein